LNTFFQIFIFLAPRPLTDILEEAIADLSESNLKLDLEELRESEDNYGQKQRAALRRAAGFFSHRKPDLSNELLAHARSRPVKPDNQRDIAVEGKLSFSFSSFRFLISIFFKLPSLDLFFQF
jgi:hypothetical protein